MRCRLSPLLISLAALLALTSCGMSTDDSFEQAKRSLAKGDRSAAIVQMKVAIQKAPEDPQLRLYLGSLYLETFDGISAEKELDRAVKLGLEQNGLVMAGLARALWLQGNHKGIVDRVQASEKFDPAPRAEILAYRGQALGALGNIEQAKEHLKIAREVAAGQAMPVIDVLEATLQFAQGDAKLALEELARILQAHPGYYDALAVRADIVGARGEPDIAIAAYSDLLKIHPKNLVALVSLSNLHIRRGWYEAAERDVQSLKSAYPNHYISFFQEGLLRFRKGQFRTALESFQQSLKRNPTFDRGQLYEGMAQLFLGNAQSAQRSLNQYVTARPNDVLGRRMLATTLIRLDESARALEVLKPMLDRSGVPPEVLDVAAEAHIRLGQFDQANALLDKVEKLRPDDARTQQRQGTINAMRGQMKAAIADYAEAARLSKTLTPADTMLVLLNLRARDFDAALGAVKLMESKASEDPFVTNLKGVVLLEQGKLKEAAATFEETLKKHPAFLPAAANLVRLDMRDGKSEQARKRFEGVLAADKNHAQALLAFADLEQQLGHTKEVIPLLERAVKAAPTAIAPRRKLVQSLIAQRNLEAALEQAKDLLARSPNDTAALELLGNTKLIVGDAQGAMAAFVKITDLNPKSPSAFVARAQAERAASMPREAESSLRKALALDKFFPPAQTMLFELLMQQKRWVNAADFAKQMQRDVPASAYGYVFEAEIAQYNKDFKTAIPLYQKALEVGKTPDLAVRLYTARVVAGQSKEALAELGRWVTANPSHIVSRAQLGRALLEQGATAEAIKHFQFLLRLAPANYYVANDLAWAYYKAGNLKEAARYAEGAHKLAPKDPYVSDTWGWIQFQQGNVKEAQALLSQAASALKDVPEVRYHYAVALLKAGDRAQAKSHLEAALTSKRPFGERAQALALQSELNR